MKRLFRIYTEDLGNVEEIANKYFEGYTVYKGIGYWNGQKENNITIEVVCSDNYPPVSNIEHCALEIKRTNKQETVLVVSFPCDVEFYI